MLENAINACPNEVWNTPSKFWYNAYHALFYLDYYLAEQPASFLPPQPFTLSEFDPEGIQPDCVYNKKELVDYLVFCRRKCHDVVANLTEEGANRRWVNEYKNYFFFEVLLYNMRHVQHHAAQLNLLLRQEINAVPTWVSQTKTNL